MPDAQNGAGTVTTPQHPNAVSVREQIEIMRTMLDRLADLPDDRLDTSEALNLVRRTRMFTGETLEYLKGF